MSDETTRVDAFLQSTLSALVPTHATGVYGDVAPPEAKYTFVVHQWQGSVDVRGVGTNRIMVSGVWLVRAVAQTRSWTVLAPAADAIDNALQGAAGAAGSDGIVFSCVRQRPFKQIEDIEGGEQIRHLGGLFSLNVQVP